MNIEDSFEVPAPRDRVWQLITDPECVAKCVPGCESVEVLGPTQYRTRIKVKVGPISASFNLEIEITEENAPETVCSRTRGEEGSRASTLSSENILRLEALDENRTNVHYAADVSVVGRLGKFGLGVMKKKAESLGRDFAECFRERVEAAGVSGGPSSESAPEDLR